MRTLLGIANIFLLLGVVVCCAGAMAGLIVILPFVAGAWGLNLIALLGYEERPVAAAPSAARQDAVAEASPWDRRQESVGNDPRPCAEL